MLTQCPCPQRDQKRPFIRNAVKSLMRQGGGRDWVQLRQIRVLCRMQWQVGGQRWRTPPTGWNTLPLITDAFPDFTGTRLHSLMIEPKHLTGWRRQDGLWGPMFLSERDSHPYLLSVWLEVLLTIHVGNLCWDLLHPEGIWNRED